MDFEQIKKWMDLAKMQQSEEFWKTFTDPSNLTDFMNETDFNGKPQNFANQSSQPKSFPLIDIYMTDLEIILLADLAGYQKENLQISVSGTKLLLKGTRPSIIPVKPIHQERHLGEFQRIVILPEPASSAEIRAKFDNGLLMIWYKRKTLEESVIIE